MHSLLSIVSSKSVTMVAISSGGQSFHCSHLCSVSACICMCQNGGTLDEGTCTCDCAGGYTGPNCESECTQCHLDPYCLHGVK